MAEGHRERMRERVRENGIRSLHPHEKLEFILFSLIPRKETNRLAHRLIERFGSLDGVFRASEAELLTVDQMTPMAALYLPQYAEIVRSAEIDEKSRLVVFNNLKTVMEFFQSVYRGAAEEQVVMIALDHSNALIKMQRLGSGSADEVQIGYPRVARFAMDSRAKKIVMGHNHLYGDARPSDADLRATWSVATFLKTIEVELYDSVIYAADTVFSFRYSGALGNDVDRHDPLKLYNAQYFYDRYDAEYSEILKKYDEAEQHRRERSYR